jgi:hypothetical protein
MVKAKAFGCQHLPVSAAAARIASCQPALLIDYSLPRQIRISKVGDAAHYSRSSGCTGQRRQLAIGHHPAARNLPHQRLNPAPEIRFHTIIWHQNTP